MADWLVSSILAISRSVAKIGQSLPSSSTSTDPLNGVEEDLMELERTMERIQAVLHDAEEREIRDQSVKLWLSELRGVAYEAEDLLDEYHYEVLRSEAEDRAAAAKANHKRKRVEEGEDGHQQQVCDLVSTSSFSSKVSISDDMGEKIREIGRRFDEIARDRDALHLRPEDGERRFERLLYPPPSGSLVNEVDVFGREDDKNEVMELLFSDEGCRFSVIPIVGMGGLGKTTLVQLVYNDPNVCRRFNLRGWVSVSIDFDVPRLTRAIIESMSKKPCDLTELSALQDTLRKEVEGKSMLLVLDNVWNEKRSLWESLQVALLGAKWARVIATTRNISVAEIMQTATSYNLVGLPEDQCRLLFQRHAFDAQNPEAHESLVEIGEKIVKKCAGLPLAVKALGCLLRGETDVERWEEVLKSDLWEFGEGEDEILPALRLSYHQLPTCLKPCLVYCSMFPKSYKFKKDELIRLWMAQGYIRPRGNINLEDIGGEYFDQLLRRSFFQMSPDFEKDKEFVIHDMMVDLVQSISREEWCTPTSREVRHLFLKRDTMVHNLSSHYKPAALRTLFVVGYSYDNSAIPAIVKLLNLEYLRALSWVRIEWLPDSIGTLKHLRYLGLDCSSGEVLPRWLHQLYNLQTLDLRECCSEQPGSIGSLANLRYLGISFRLNCHMVLPSGIGDLINLRHLIIPFYFDGMHESIRKLTNLRSLSHFKVTRCTGIGELKGMVHLGGRIEIHGLKKVASAAEARQADLKGKQHIESLHLSWTSRDVTIIEEELEAAVLESLRPHTNLQELKIHDYQGAIFPSWIADPSFSKLVSLSLCFNRNIVSLPPLGCLPALKSLQLKALNGVRCISCCRLQGENTSADAETRKIRFPSLEKLQIIRMDQLEMWEGVLDGDFPHLHLLRIKDCPKLRRLPTLPLLQLQTLKIACCGNLSSIPLQQNSGRRPSMLQELHIEDCTSLTSVMAEWGKWDVDFPHLQYLLIENCPKLTRLPTLPLLQFPYVHIIGCDTLSSISVQQNSGRPSKLKVLHITNCPSLTSVMAEWDKWDGVQDSVIIQDCPKLRQLPTFPLLQFQNVEIIRCGNLSSIPLQQISGLPSRLQKLRIMDCSHLTSVMGLHNADSLEKLEITLCPELRFLPEPPSKLQDFCLADYRTHTLMTRNQNLTLLGQVLSQVCPDLQRRPDEWPEHVETIDWSRLQVWCQRNKFTLFQAYVQKQESSILKLSQLEQKHARQQGIFISNSGEQSHSMDRNGTSPFYAKYRGWLEEHNRMINKLRAAVNSLASDDEIRVIVDGLMLRHDEFFRLKSVANKADILHMLSGMWKTPVERCFLWLGGFRPSELCKLFATQLESLTEQQLVGFRNLQESSQQAEDALSQEMEALQQSLAETLAGSLGPSDSLGNVANYMPMTKGKLDTLKKFLVQADKLRQQTLHEMHRILTTHQSARAFLIVGNYFLRIRFLNVLFMMCPSEEVTQPFQINYVMRICPMKSL